MCRGGDWKTASNMGMQTGPQCQKLCDQDPMCKGWDSTNGKNDCYLHKNVGIKLGCHYRNIRVDATFITYEALIDGYQRPPNI